MKNIVVRQFMSLRYTNKPPQSSAPYFRSGIFANEKDFVDSSQLIFSQTLIQLVAKLHKNACLPMKNIVVRRFVSLSYKNKQTTAIPIYEEFLQL